MSAHREQRGGRLPVRRRWRAASATVVAVALFLGACSGGRGEASIEEMLLRLGDLPAGTRLGDDGACGQGFSLEGASDAFRSWVLAHREARSCLREFQFRADGGAWGFVLSAAVAFDDAGEAEASSDGADELLTYWGRPGADVVTPPFSVGRTQLAWRLPGAGPEFSGTALSWTAGRHRHYVVVTGIPFEEAERTATGLATAQQERYEHPSPLTKADLDDSRAGLTGAGGFPVYWVGDEWAPPAGGATAVLVRSEVQPDRGIGPGYAARLEYESAGSSVGAFDIGTWTRAQWAAMLAGPLGPVALPGCAAPREIVLADRRIEIHGMGRAPDCFSSASAYVFFEDVVVSILFPHCLVCQPRPSAYSSPAYLEGVARGLRRYE